MADTPSLADAAAIVAAAELDAAKAILAAADTFASTLAAIITRLDFPAGYSSQPKQIAQGMIASLTYQQGTQLPQIIKAYDPTATTGA